MESGSHILPINVPKSYRYPGTNRENGEDIISRSHSSPSILQFLLKIFLERSVHDLVTNRLADLLGL